MVTLDMPDCQGYKVCIAKNNQPAINILVRTHQPVENRKVKSGWHRLCRCLAGALALAVLGGAVTAWACSVPVFRYALERWAPDPYQAVVFHRGPLTDAQKAAVASLSPDGLAGELHANLIPRAVDLDREENRQWQTLWQEQKSDTLPWVAVHFPPATRIPVNVWSGPLDAKALRPVLDSPMRKQIAQRLAKGESAVWVLLESGDKAKDDATAQLLQARLDFLMRELKPPQLDPQDVASGLVSVGQDALRVIFTLARLSRSDPAEQTFVKMLLGTEEDLKDTKAPIAFPIFGRGRALYALVGAGINNDTIDDACTFLIGSCSCQVKEQNPGVDLLLAMDWDNQIQSQMNVERELPPLAGLAGFVGDKTASKPAASAPAAEPSEKKPATVPAPPASVPPPPPPPAATGGGLSILGTVAVVGGIGFAAVVIASLFLLRRKGPAR